MKKDNRSLFILITFSILCFSAVAQTKFQTGYFVDRQGTRTECLIRDEDWLRSPRTIRYKASTDSEQISIDISDLKEFGVSDARYICAEVKMDTSSQETKKLTTIRSPFWSTRYVALKLVADGNAKLFHYDDKKVLLFFYSVDNSPIEQLEYKSYLVSIANQSNFEVGRNLNYINQLKQKVSCGDVFTKYAVNKFKYTSDFLIDYFERYNKCSGGAQPATTEIRHKKESFHLRLTPGINLGTARVSPYSSNGEFSDYEPSFRIGVEAEIVLPFRNNKWRIFIEPTYRSFKTDAPVAVEYSSIEMPAGLRHYFFLNDDLTIFLSGAIVFDFIIDLDVQFNNGLIVSMTESQDASTALGAGIGYKRLSFEGRYYFPRYRFDENIFYECDYKQIGFIVGFRLF